MSIIERYRSYLAPSYSNYPSGRYISLLLVRVVESEAIFRTEGSGEPLNREFVFAGRTQRDLQEQPIPRIVISKRKQTAVERRTGRELLRRYDLLLKEKKGQVCSLNTNTPCEKCIDCMIYGYAAGGGGAQKSRVITDDAFSLHSADIVLGTRQFNALFETGTMRDRGENNETKTSSSIGTDEYVRPQSVFIDIETLKDVTEDEFCYIVGNILRSTRYGAVSSRIGRTHNILAGVIFSDCELFSNLELTQTVYDLLDKGDGPAFPLHPDTIVQEVRRAADLLRSEVLGQVVILRTDEIDELRRELIALYGDEQALQSILQRLTKSYGPSA